MLKIANMFLKCVWRPMTEKTVFLPCGGQGIQDRKKKERDCLPFHCNAIEEMDCGSQIPNFDCYTVSPADAIFLQYFLWCLQIIELKSEEWSRGPRLSVLQHVPYIQTQTFIPSNFGKTQRSNPLVSLFHRGHLNWLQLDRRVLEHDFPKKSGPVVLYFCVRYEHWVSTLLLFFPLCQKSPGG